MRHHEVWPGRSFARRMENRPIASEAIRVHAGADEGPVSGKTGPPSRGEA